MAVTEDAMVVVVAAEEVEVAEVAEVVKDATGEEAVAEATTGAVVVLTEETKRIEHDVFQLSIVYFEPEIKSEIKLYIRPILKICIFFMLCFFS